MIDSRCAAAVTTTFACQVHRRCRCSVCSAGSRTYSCSRLGLHGEPETAPAETADDDVWKPVVRG
ncbi:hypothetical protein [Amycolatopsis sp. NPDC050768]|uniref:hypothetical protein n=1 Tax=Amycolatopsis sp. NPDC050768 TaxID=3154839 RepID=UPI0033E5543C